MQRRHAFVTADGSVFLDHAAAFSHANERYGNAMLALAKEIAAIEKYSTATDWLRDNLDRLVALKALQDDTKISIDRDDDEDC